MISNNMNALNGRLDAVIELSTASFNLAARSFNGNSAPGSGRLKALRKECQPGNAAAAAAVGELPPLGLFPLTCNDAQNVRLSVACHRPGCVGLVGQRGLWWACGLLSCRLCVTASRGVRSCV